MLTLFHRFTGALRALVQKTRVERELDDELREYLEASTARKMSGGMTRDEALRAARVEAGSLAAVKDRVRDVGWESVIEAVWQDLRYACRILRRSRGFAVATILSLALGIGANTAIFTLLDAAWWRMLPVRSPETLLVVGQQEGNSRWTGFNYGDYRLMRDSGAADLAGYTSAPMNVSIDGPPEPTVRGQLVTGAYFSVLGVAPVLGRAIGPDDDRVPNGHPVVMLSHGYWARRFARNPSVVGRTLRLSGTPFTIVGITPPEFFGVEVGTAPDLFAPIMMQPLVMPAFENLLDNPIVNRTWVQVVARMKPGVTPAQAAAVIDATFKARSDQTASARDPREGPVPRTIFSPTTAVSALRRQFSNPLFVLMAMVGVVLLIACANTANLLLARSAARAPEFAMRLALGAGRSRVIRQLLVESVVLAGLGGVCGVFLARWATRALVAFMSSGRTPISLDLAPNVRILAFTAAVSMLTGLLFGLAPAWRATRIDLMPALKGLRGTLVRSRRLDRGLTVAQLALSLLLIVAAGLFVRSLQHLTGSDPDRLRQQIVMLRVEPRGSDQRNIPGTTERLDRTYRELIERIGQISGVRTVSFTQGTPTVPRASNSTEIALPSGVRINVPVLMTYPNYFASIGIPIVKGRDFGRGDLQEQSPAVCLVNEAYVRRVFGDADPIGKPCDVDRRARLLSLPRERPTEPFTIVGVVGDSRYSNPGRSAEPMIYETFLQANTGRGQMVLHLRVDGNPGVVVQRIREVVAGVDPTLPMFDAHTLAEEMNAALVQHRLVALLSTAFGSLALLLASLGLYGLLAFGVVQRRNELGIRVALGAGRGDVAWLVVRDALVLVAVGVAIGVPAAIVVARLASSQIAGLLYGLRATDPLTIGAAAAILAAVAVVAAYLPARRASRVDPMVALRTE